LYACVPINIYKCRCDSFFLLSSSLFYLINELININQSKAKSFLLLCMMCRSNYFSFSFFTSICVYSSLYVLVLKNVTNDNNSLSTRCYAWVFFLNRHLMMQCDSWMPQVLSQFYLKETKLNRFLFIYVIVLSSSHCWFNMFEKEERKTQIVLVIILFNDWRFFFM